MKTALRMWFCKVSCRQKSACRDKCETESRENVRGSAIRYGEILYNGAAKSVMNWIAGWRAQLSYSSFASLKPFAIIVALEASQKTEEVGSEMRGHVMYGKGRRHEK